MKGSHRLRYFIFIFSHLDDLVLSTRAEGNSEGLTELLRLLFMELHMSPNLPASVSKKITWLWQILLLKCRFHRRAFKICYTQYSVTAKVYLWPFNHAFIELFNSLGALFSHMLNLRFPFSALVISFSPIWGPQFCSSSSIEWAAWNRARWHSRALFDPVLSEALTPTTWGRCPPRSSRSPQGRCTEDTCPRWWGHAFSVWDRSGFAQFQIFF